MTLDPYYVSFTTNCNIWDINLWCKCRIRKERLSQQKIEFIQLRLFHIDFVFAYPQTYRQYEWKMAGSWSMELCVVWGRHSVGSHTYSPIAQSKPHTIGQWPRAGCSCRIAPQGMLSNPQLVVISWSIKTNPSFPLSSSWTWTSFCAVEWRGGHCTYEGNWYGHLVIAAFALIV